MAKDKKYYEDLALEILREGVVPKDMDAVEGDILLERALTGSGNSLAYVGLLLDKKLETSTRKEILDELESIASMVKMMMAIDKMKGDVDPTLN